MTRCRCLWIKQSFQVYLPPFESLLKFTELDEKDTVDFAVRLICRILNIFPTAHLSSTFIPLKLEEKFDRSLGSILQYLNRMISLSIPSVITFVRKSRFEKKKRNSTIFLLSSFLPFLSFAILLESTDVKKSIGRKTRPSHRGGGLAIPTRLVSWTIVHRRNVSRGEEERAQACEIQTRSRSINLKNVAVQRGRDRIVG